MAFSHALSNALSGMTAASTAIQVRAGNIANATTPGYARRDVALDTGPFGGVRVTSIVRSEDSILLGNRLSADARNQSLQEQARAAASINTAFGEPGDVDGLFATLSRFYSSLEDLANAPDSGAYQQSAIDGAKDLTRTFNRLGQAATDLRTNADRDIAATVADVNAAIKALSDLNKSASGGTGQALSGLAEQRQTYIDTVGNALNIKVSYGRGGSVHIRTAEGVVLLDENPREISFAASGVVAPGTRLSAAQLSGLSVDGIDVTPDSGPQSIKGGRLRGLFSVRDEIGVSFEERLDTLAEDFVTRFSDSTVDPTLAVGDEGVFVSGGSGAGVASRIAVNSALDPESGGAIWRIRDGINAATPGPSAGVGVTAGLLDALDTQRPLGSVTGSPANLSAVDAIAAFSSVIGTEKVQAGTRAAASAATAQSLKDEELSAHGVNTDQELQSLLLIEQSYAANARVVQVVDNMLARLMEI